jgi:polar amino acid transport system substrate-binding protein
MRRRRVVGSLVGTALLAPAWLGRPQTVPADARSSLAPGGTLRAAINYGNAVLARRDADGTLHGVSVDIAHELARRLDMPLAMTPFDAAGKVTAAAASQVWDVAFLARDPERARAIRFTAAYVIIEGNYVVAAESPITRVAEADRDGVRIAVAGGSAYDLFLKRALKHAQIIRAGSTPEAVALFRAQKLDVLAGVKQALVPVVAGDPGLRMISEPFMAINQAMGTPTGRPAGAAYLAAFVEDIKASGFVAAALARNGQADATVAPPA